MNTKTRRRMVVAAGVIVLAVVIMLAVIGSAGTARVVSVADALAVDGGTERVQVTGSVVDNSFETEDGVLSFDVYDPEGDAGQVLHVSYEGAASSTFGNGVTAICTGMLDASQGSPVLYASEMVTQCPSKYESATDALSVSRLLDYGSDIVDTTVRVTGTIEAGSLTAAGVSDARFVLADAEAAATAVPVCFDGALPEGISDGSSVVVTGSLSSDGTFSASDVAQEG